MTRIANDRTTVVCPIIDVISDDTFEYVTASDQTWGGFNWKLNFRWYRVPHREMERRHNDKTAPLRSPTMAGGLFSIDKDFFYEIGSYDEGMDIWGGENLEMSFRVSTVFFLCFASLYFFFCVLPHDRLHNTQNHRIHSPTRMSTQSGRAPIGTARTKCNVVCWTSARNKKKPLHNKSIKMNVARNNLDLAMRRHFRNYTMLTRRTRVP